jgi:hypothetical protein
LCKKAHPEQFELGHFRAFEVVGQAEDVEVADIGVEIMQLSRRLCNVI